MKKQTKRKVEWNLVHGKYPICGTCLLVSGAIGCCLGLFVGIVIGVTLVALGG